MKFEDLLNLIDIEDGSQFTYFENLAAILEADEKIESEVLHSLLKDVDMNTLAELTESFFYDLMENMPEDVDVYNLLEAEKRNLISMTEAISRDEEGALRKLSDELERFHDYFSGELNCEIIDQDRGTSIMATLRDAVAEHRAAKVTNRNIDFDLSGASSYDIEEYIVSVGDLM